MTTSTINIKNPWIPHSKMTLLHNNVLVDIKSMTVQELKTIFKDVYILTSTIVNTNDMLDNETYNNMKQSIKCNRVPYNILYNNILLNMITIVSYADLPVINNILFMENNLIISVMGVGQESVQRFTMQYDGITTLFKIAEMFVMNNYFQNTITYETNKIIRRQMISSMIESNYWSIYKNTRLNISNAFIERKFNYCHYLNTENNVIKQQLMQIYESSTNNNDYLTKICLNKNYVDASASVKKNGYKIYTISNKNEYNSMNYNEFNYIATSCVDKQEFYTLIMNVLISKENCHLVINNLKILEMIQDDKLFNENATSSKQRSILKKYTPIFSHVLSYAWLCLYLEESIKKTYCNVNDRFVFNIDTACQLPYFPYDISSITTNPYISLLVNNDILQSNNNVYGVKSYICNSQPTNKQFIPGIIDKITFEKRINIFLSGDENINYFENVNWTNLAISGSIMAACLPRFNPLMLNFYDESTNIIDYNKYFNEYYRDADIDIMCNASDKFKYIDTVNELKETIYLNIIKQYSHLPQGISYINKDAIITTTMYKTAAIMINKTFIEKYILPKTTLSYIDILLNCNTLEIKQLLYEYYINFKTVQINKYKQNIEFQNHKYNDVYTLCLINDIIITVITDQTPNNVTPPTVDNDPDIETVKHDEVIEPEVIETTEPYIYINENMKYRIKSKYLKHEIEIFKTKYVDFFSTVSRFHLPIVRAYYNGDTVYMLPSCITACMIFMNIDYKYFAGSRDPIEIINKYRMRGFGTFLNDIEKSKLIEYSYKIDKWNKLYNIRITKKYDIEIFFKPMEYTNDFFKISKKLYLDNTISYNTVSTHDFVVITKLARAYRSIYDGDYEIDNLQMKCVGYKTCIDTDGYVIKFNKFLIDMSYISPIKKL